MLYFDVTLEDTRMIGEGNQDGTWNVQLHDTTNGKCEEKVWTDEEVSAILALGVGGAVENKFPGYDGAMLYAVAEKACEGLTNELRPIP